MFEISINIGGLDALADSINNIADALRAGVTATEVIGSAKASSRKSRTPAAAAPELGKSGPTDTATSATPASTAPAAETPPDAPAPSTPAALSDAQVTALTATQAATVAPAVPPVHGAPTVAEVRAALAALVKTDKPRALAILQKHGAASVSALKEESYAAVLAEATK